MWLSSFPQGWRPQGAELGAGGVGAGHAAPVIAGSLHQPLLWEHACREW